MIDITSVYRFLPLTEAEIERIQTQLEAYAAHAHVRGLVLLGPEGINLTVSGEATALKGFKDLLRRELSVDDLFFKDSKGPKHPFHTFKVKIKDEIVTLGRPGLMPDGPIHRHLSPAEWHQALQDPNTIVLDTRNDYEVDIGKFKGAIDFRIKEFREFPEKLKNSGLPKDKRVLIYCTGGIRCEKAILEMENQGFSQVNQLDGGILNYLEQFPEQAFEGECFVFDYRVAVDQQLQPTSQYKLCPHCGQPADMPIQCTQCTTATIICRNCSGEGIDTCSKNCAHHRAIGSASTKPHVQELHKRHKI